VKKIFILIPWFHPAYKAGGPIQSIANFVNKFDNDYFQFNIFCSNKDMDDSLLQGVAFDEWIQYNTCTKVWYSSTNSIMTVLQAAQKKENPDYLFVTGMYDWQYNFKPLLFCNGVKKIISVRGMLHPGALSQKGFKKKIYLQLWKMLGLHKQHIFHATDEAEKCYIQDVFGISVKVKLAANFPRVLNFQPFIKKETGHLKLVSIALISTMKNILLVLEAIGSKQMENGSIEYNIYGPIKEKKYWEACEALIKKMPANITVKYHGDIAPDKITHALAANHVFILPSKSENFGHSIYEALSAGRPVITSNNTPWQNLEVAKAGVNVFLNNTNELQKAIGFFAMMNQVQLEMWGTAAKAYAETAINVEAINQQYKEMFI
jgi:glycosyltransferase involved in cell wall biosynthesis